jgi:hypothetical protein
VPELDVIHQAGVPRVPGNARCRVRVMGGRDGLRRRFRRSLPQRAGVVGDVCAVCFVGECVRTRRRFRGNLPRRTGLFGRRVHVTPAVVAPSFASFPVMCGASAEDSLSVREHNDTSDRHPEKRAAIL